MIDPETVVLAMPAHDGRMMVETCASFILSKPRYVGFMFPAEVTGPSLVRSIIAHKFLQIPSAQWLVCIDNDIAISPHDFDLLLQPTVENEDPNIPTPSRVPCAMIDFPDPQGAPVRSVQAADALVYAEYPYKDDSGRAVKMGMGAVRIHRSVFEALDNLTHPPEDFVRLDKAFFDSLPRTEAGCVVVNADRFTHDAGGEARIQKLTFQGTLISNYFPEGAALAGMIPNATWKGEDIGFFTLCMLANVIPRVETRTRLRHIGRKAYEYVPEGERIIGQ